MTNGWSGVKNISGLHTEALVLSGIAPRIKHSHKTLGLRPRVLCSCFMLGIIPDKTAASVCIPYIIICWEVFKPYKNLLGGFYRLLCHACAEAIAVHVNDFEILRCPHFGKKSDTEIKSWSRWQPGTAGSEITELPTTPRGSWRVQVIEKASCLWFLCPMMDLGKRRCLQVPTRRTAPVNHQWLALRGHFLPPRNGGRDRALLQNDRRKFLNSFPFFFIPKDYCVTRIAIMVEVKNLNTLKASALVLSRNKPSIKPSAAEAGKNTRSVNNCRMFFGSRSDNSKFYDSGFPAECNPEGLYSKEAFSVIWNASVPVSCLWYSWGPPIPANN